MASWKKLAMNSYKGVKDRNGLTHNILCANFSEVFAFSEKGIP